MVLSIWENAKGIYFIFDSSVKDKDEQPRPPFGATFPIKPSYPRTWTASGLMVMAKLNSKYS